MGNYANRYYYKDGKVMNVSSSYSVNQVDRNFFPIVMNTKRYYIGNAKYVFHYDVEGNMINVQKRTSTDEDYQKIETYASYREGNGAYQLLFANPLEVAIKAKIKSINFDGVECYSIETHKKDEVNHYDEDVVFYFEKATGILRKWNDTEYYYLFNVVNDEIFELPEIPEQFKENMEK